MRDMPSPKTMEAMRSVRASMKPISVTQVRGPVALARTRDGDGLSDLLVPVRLGCPRKTKSVHVCSPPSSYNLDQPGYLKAVEFSSLASLTSTQRTVNGFMGLPL